MIMDDLDGVDYSADMLAAEDIWRTPGRHTLAGDLLGFEPEVGFRVDPVWAFEGSTLSPSAFLVSSTPDPGLDGVGGGVDFGLEVDLEGCPG